MTDPPAPDRENRNDIGCPHCASRIPEDAPDCPYCRQPVAGGTYGAGQDIRELLVPPDRFPRLREYFGKYGDVWEEYGKWVKVAGLAFLGALLLWFAAGFLARLKVVIPSDNVFLIEAERERKDGGKVLLKGKIVNRGEDVPDLSLRSIGVIAEFLHGDGKTERKRIFPKSPFRGEGALFRGESGTFEIEVPAGVKSVTLRGEIVNLGEDRVFVPATRGIRALPAQRKR